MIKSVGFIGLGEMGNPMARNLLSAGYDLWVTDILTKRVGDLVKIGANGVDNAAEVARNIFKAGGVITRQLEIDTDKIQEMFSGACNAAR